MKVSVVIPAFNDEGTIAATVESALAQRFDGDFEVIVVNDGSTDGTRAELAKFGARIRVIDQANRGVSAARNAGIRAASGEYIAFLDGDDTWTEDKLAKTVPVLDENPACVAVSSNAIGVDAAGRVVSYPVTPEFRHSPTLDEMLDRLWAYLPSTVVVRRDTLQAIGGFSEDFKPEHYACEDTFIMLLVRERGEIIYVPDPLVRYRRREFYERLANRLPSRRFEADSAAAFRKFERRFEANDILARLTKEHFGARGRKIAALAIDSVAREMIGLGLMAMHQGDRALARRCYRASIRYNPLTLKTYFRLG
ncbi:MAG TPA: glycosyltransferase family A protein, partial [Candidatus Binatus sp.]|nr:glycosyltransferase family A protein [Candidatus Binatus sp.]